jgi:YNFM family putative membrane transporter
MPVVIILTILTFSALYAPQPLLPVLARDYAVSRDTAAYLITAVFLPLSLAPLFYGRILAAWAPRRMLRIAVLQLAVATALFPLCSTFPLLLAVRFWQGLLVPAILTALMTYVASEAAEGQQRRAMAIYIASTILGGLLGRVMSGSLATLLGWPSSFYLLAGSLLAVFFLLGRLAPGRPPQARTGGDLKAIFRCQPARRIYLGVFCFFFAFAAVMNTLPFRVSALAPGASEMRIGFIYSGYALGIASALGAIGLARRLGGARRTMQLGLCSFGLCLMAMLVPDATALFLLMFPFCGSMFLVHALASGQLNALGLRQTGLVNGLYICFYYGGGILGSSLPVLIYQRFGWSAFIALLTLFVAGALLAVAGLPIEKSVPDNINT